MRPPPPPHWGSGELAGPSCRGACPGDQREPGAGIRLAGPGAGPARRGHGPDHRQRAADRGVRGRPAHRDGGRRSSRRPRHAGRLRRAGRPAAGDRRPVPEHVPAESLATAAARLALPPAVPHADAARNGARAALLIAALTADPGLLMDATEDFLHQRYRAAAMPRTAALIGSLRSAGIPAVVSGAGPAVLALTVAGRTPGAEAVASVTAAEGPGWQVCPLGVDAQGARVTAGSGGDG